MDVHLFTVTASPLRRLSVQIESLILSTTSSLQACAYLGMTALQRGSWAHIKTDTMCCFKLLGPIKFHRLAAYTHTHTQTPCSWGSDSERWKAPSVTHRSHNLCWHKRTQLPMERCRFTHILIAGQGSRLLLSFRAIQRKQWRGSRKAPCGMVNNQREWDREEERKRLRKWESEIETNPVWQRYMEHQVQNMTIWGQVNSTNVQSFRKNLTLLEWKICQLHDAEKKNTHEERMQIISPLYGIQIFCNTLWKCSAFLQPSFTSIFYQL